MKIQAVILDIDGTLTRAGRDQLPSQRVADSVFRAQSKAIVSVATGRPFKSAKLVTDYLRIDNPSVFKGGAEIFNPATEEVLLQHTIERTAQYKVLELGVRFKVDTAISGAYQALTKQILDDYQEPISLMLYLGLDKRQTIELIEELEAIEGVEGHPTSTWTEGADHDIHITPVGVNKLHAVKELIEILGVKKEEVLAIGDSHNDLPLFEAVGFKVAMGDAPDELKAAADFIAPTFEEDGVAVALDKFVN